MLNCRINTACLRENAELLPFGFAKKPHHAWTSNAKHDKTMTKQDKT